MKRSHILARELRGSLLVLLVAAMIVWLFARLNDDRLEAAEQRASLQPVTSVDETTTTTTTIVIDDNERLCSLSTKFRSDLRDIKVKLVNLAGDPVDAAGLPVDVGLHPDGDLPTVSSTDRTVAEGAISDPETDQTTTTEAAQAVAIPPPEFIDTSRIDPLESGLLGEPQKVALNFYTASSALRLGSISADFASSARFFADFVEIGEPALWDLEELAESDFSDQWTALATRPVYGIDATLAYIEEECSIRIGRGFVYRERQEKLVEFEPPTELLNPIDPSVDPTR